MNSGCKYIFKRGKRRGLTCNNACNNTVLLCIKHINNINDTNNKEQLIKNNDTNNKEESIKNTNSTKINKLPIEDTIKNKILSLDTCIENKTVILKHYNNMKRVDPNSTEFYKNQMYIDYALAYPWNKIFNINTFLKNTNIKSFLYYLKSSFDKEIYGMDNVKNEIMNMVCKMITNPHSTRNNIALHGQAGVGKSKFIKVLSDVLGIPLKIISLGGVKDSSFFLGHGYVYVESGPGKILQNIIDSKIANPIIYFDELDKVSESDSGKDIFSFLSYLTDPTQNTDFTDHYFYGMKFDLSKVMYVFTFNDQSKIDKVLLDRLNIIHVKTPKKDEIYTILQEYCIPEIIKNIGITKNIKFSKEQIHNIIDNYSNKFDKNVSSGIREYYRIFEKILLEINKDILLDKFTENKIQLDKSQFSYYIDIINKQYPDDTSDFITSHMYI